MDKFFFNLLGFHPSFLFSHFQVAVIQFHHYFAHKHMNAVALHNMRSTNSTNCGQLNKLFNGEKKNILEILFPCSYVPFLNKKEHMSHAIHCILYIYVEFGIVVIKLQCTRVAAWVPILQGTRAAITASSVK